MNCLKCRASVKFLMGLVLCSLLFVLSACDSESIVVPTSDATPPTVSMSVSVTTSDGNRKTFDLTPSSAPVSLNLNPNEPIAVVASGRDKDGGVKGVIVSGHIREFCEGDVLGTDLSLTDVVLGSGGPGDTVATVKLAELTHNPLDHCPDGDANTSGSLFAIAENFHNGRTQTATFSFAIGE